MDRLRKQLKDAEQQGAAGLREELAEANAKLKAVEKDGAYLFH